MVMYLGDQEVAPIVPVEVPETLYGATVGMVFGKEPIGDLSFDGIETVKQFSLMGRFSSFDGIRLSKPECTISFPDLTNIELYGLAYMFLTVIQSTTPGAFKINFSFPKLKQIENYGLYDFMGGYGYSAAYLANQISLPALEELPGTSCLENAFANGGGSAGILETLSLPALRVISGARACRGAFQNQTTLTTVNLPALTTISGTGACHSMFNGCSSLTSIGFPALTSIATNVFGTGTSTYIFGDCPALTEIHFPSNMQAAVEAMSGYSAKWGATNAQILFDLDPTAE